MTDTPVDPIRSEAEVQAQSESRIAIIAIIATMIVCLACITACAVAATAFLMNPPW